MNAKLTEKEHFFLNYKFKPGQTVYAPDKLVIVSVAEDKMLECKKENGSIVWLLAIHVDFID